MKKKEVKFFSLEEKYNGKCNSVGLVVKDVLVGDEKAAMLFISLTFDGKLVEAHVPLNDIKDFKRHILAIIDEASSLKPKSPAKTGKKVTKKDGK
jgi:hypothetical protein